MNKLMRRAPAIAAAVFLLVQISGLADYANQAGGMDDTRAMLFALALEAGIFVAAYSTRYQPSRVAAIVTLVLFLLVSGFLNTAKSWRDLPANADDLARISAVLFGVVPSLFATALGALQSYLAKLPPLAKSPAVDTPLTLVYAYAMQRLTLVNARLSAEPAQDAPNYAKRCDRCGQMVQDGKKPGKMGAHAKHNCPKRKQVTP